VPDGPAVALVTHNSESDLRDFLPGQLAAAKSIQAPVVVVDNASVDGTLSMLHDAAGAHPHLIVHEMGSNAGYSAAVNAVFARAPGRDVLLINPDVELETGDRIVALARVLERDAAVGIAAPRLVGDDGDVQPSARRFPSLAAMVGSTGAARFAPFLGRRYERFIAPSRSERPRTVDWVIGAAMLIRRAAYEEVGGWDERFFLYIEDTDFCRRLARAGWGVAYVPSISLRHRYPRESRTTGSFASSRARRSHVAGLARLWRSEPRLLLGRGGVPVRDVDAGEGS
jgi:N-acetylglucosaminyl-diphospho-decaprenol L-rhamnosyltransferase